VQVAAIEGEILLVSQFTLYGRLKKPKPDYSKAMGPDQVRPVSQLLPATDSELAVPVQYVPGLVK
jgi:D-tyrosyl-tRNA(Tyr) deacylase